MNLVLARSGEWRDVAEDVDPASPLASVPHARLRGVSPGSFEHMNPPATHADDKLLERVMKSETYSAAIFRGPGSVDLIKKPYPSCGDDDIIVRNLLTGVCGSDIAAYKHGGDDYMIWKDHEFGHEALSEVVEIGKNVEGLALGDHVFPNRGNALRDKSRVSTVGGFSEYIRIPECEVGYSVFKIDNDIAIRSAVLFEPFLVGTNAALNVDPGPDKSAIVFGAGIIGVSTAIMLQWYGCAKVMLVDISDFRLQTAKNLGFLTCNSAAEDLKARAFAEFGSRTNFMGERCSAELYIDAVGLPAVIENFKELAGADASLVVLGVHHAPVAFNLVELCYNNWHIHGCGSTPAEVAMVDILEVMRSRRYDLSSLVTHEYKIDQLVDALVVGRDASVAQKVCISF